MELTFEGHACFSLHNDSAEILIDPFIRENPQCGKEPEDFAPHYILVSHGHRDHLGDAVAIAGHSNALLIASTDLLAAIDCKGCRTLGLNLGGMVDLPGCRIRMVPAWHSSSTSTPEWPRYAGMACGFLIEMDGLRIYHAGDTALFGDMKTVIGRYSIDCALLPIGGRYTMGMEDALVAVQWLNARWVIPMHYNTFPAIQQDAEAFCKAVVSRSDSCCVLLKPGESFAFA